jgi:hypothetical protein
MKGVAFRVETAHLFARMLKRGRFEVKADLNFYSGSDTYEAAIGGRVDVHRLPNNSFSTENYEVIHAEDHLQKLSPFPSHPRGYDITINYFYL